MTQDDQPSEQAERIKQALRRPRITRTSISRRDLLSTGSTLLNLAMSGYPQGGIAKGWYVHFVGDSQCGKTFFAHTLLAEAANNSEFDDYRLVFDDIENGAFMDKERYFGKKCADRLEAPSYYEDGSPEYSRMAEEMYFNIYNLLNTKKPKPIIYVVDSLDALSSKYEEQKFNEKRLAHKKGTKAKGDYGDGKAKIHSGNIRQVVSRLRDTGSILFCISQTRDILNAEMFGPTSTYSGGRALKFYTSMQLWGSVGQEIKKTVRGTKRKIGMTARIKVKKNRSTGKERTVEIPIYYSYGLDDLQSCINFLLDEKHWGKKNKTGTEEAKEEGIGKRTRPAKFSAPEFDYEGSAEGLIEHIEENEKYGELQALVTRVWNELEKECELVRKPRYE